LVKQQNSESTMALLSYCWCYCL